MARTKLLPEAHWKKLLVWAQESGVRLNPNPAWAGIAIERPTQIGDGIYLQEGTYKPER